MKSYSGHTFAKVYKDILHDLVEDPEYVCSPRDQKIKESLNVSIQIKNPLSCLYTNEARSSQLRYIAAEFVYYFSARNDLAFIEKYAKFWKDIANIDNTVNSAYGNLIFNPSIYSSQNINAGGSQWEWAYNSLVKDKDSRQALMHFNMPKHQYDGNRDFVCTLNGIFHIRDNKLDFTIMMRSNDVILGMATDIAFFCTLQQQMYKLLKKVYPELRLGKYTHIVNSLHLYERNFKIVEEMLKHDFVEMQMHELDKDLVDIYGIMTPEMQMLHNIVNNDKVKLDASFNDPLYDWILKNVK